MFQRPNEFLSWKPAAKPPDMSESTTLQCEFCLERFVETELPIHHRISHKLEIKKQMKQNKDSFCGTCLKSFECHEELVKHTLSVHLYCSEYALRIEHEIFACDHCQQIFFTKLSLRNHIIFMHLKQNEIKTKKLINCHFCNKKIPMRYYWVHATKHAHLNYMVYCFRCDLKFHNQAMFKEHFRSHPKHYYCDICNFSFKTEVMFNLHVESHRNSITLPSDEKKIERYYLSNHHTDLWKMRKSVFFSGIWLPDDIYICVFCREIVYSDHGMRIHIQSHRHKPVEPKKVYACECGEEFTNKILLKQHKFQFKGSHTQEDIKKALETPKINDLLPTDETTNSIQITCDPSHETSTANNHLEDENEKYATDDVTETQDVIVISANEMDCSEIPSTDADERVVVFVLDDENNVIDHC